MSLYSLKKGAGGGAVQPWSQVITLAEAGKGCDGLFGLYDSLGDKTLTGANTIATLQDGPEKVTRYGALTLGDGVMATSLTASQRCKGLVILCDSLAVKANATLHMTGKGARVLVNDDPFFPFDDYYIPFRVVVASSRMTLDQVLAVVKEQGLAPWDRGTFQALVAPMYAFDLGVTHAGSLPLMLASKCGTGGAGGIYCYGGGVGAVGVAGINGGFGGGGGGGATGAPDGNYQSHTGAGGGTQGCVYGGGAGGGGNWYYATARDNYMPTLPGYSTWGQPGTCGCTGGGAGIPGLGSTGGNGTGGKLTIICRGAITVQSGGKIEANGMPGTAYGGGSGGGHISIISLGVVSNAGTIQAAGGAGGSPAGNGGAGSVVTKTFSDMGW